MEDCIFSYGKVCFPSQNIGKETSSPSSIFSLKAEAGEKGREGPRERKRAQAIAVVRSRMKSKKSMMNGVT